MKPQLNGVHVENANPVVALTADAGPRRVRNDLIGALALMAIGVGALALQRAGSGGHTRSDDRRRNLVAYLRDHLSGADAAIRVVDGLMREYEGTSEGTLFAALDQQFREDRSVVVTILATLGASSRSVKRLVGRTTGGLLQTAAGAKPGTLALVRTLEGLAIGVQGKRCLWRSLQVLASSLQVPAERSFIELESRAVDQWERIERCRRSVARQTLDA